ncbi:MAG TPA: hypothetical protein VGC32_20915 [Solirubrobacterales bacterium]
MSALIFAFIEASIAAALGPIGSGGNSVEAAGVPSTIPGIPSNPDPNSTAPKVVVPGSVFTSRSIACTRNLFGSVTSIDPESSMIASIFVTGVHPAEAVATTAADATPANAIVAIALQTSAARALLNDFIFLSWGRVNETSSEYETASLIAPAGENSGIGAERTFVLVG